MLEMQRKEMDHCHSDVRNGRLKERDQKKVSSLEKKKIRLAKKKPVEERQDGGLTAEELRVGEMLLLDHPFLWSGKKRGLKSCKSRGKPSLGISTGQRGDLKKKYPKKERTDLSMRELGPDKRKLECPKKRGGDSNFIPKKGRRADVTERNDFQ